MGKNTVQGCQQQQRDQDQRTRVHATRKARRATHSTQPQQPEITVSFRQQHAKTPLQGGGPRVACREANGKAAGNRGVSSISRPAATPTTAGDALLVPDTLQGAERHSEGERKRKRVMLSSSSSSSPTVHRPSPFKAATPQKASPSRPQRAGPITSLLKFRRRLATDAGHFQLPVVRISGCPAPVSQREGTLENIQDAFTIPVTTTDACSRLGGFVRASSLGQSPFSSESAYSVSPYSPGFMADVAKLMDRVQQDANSLPQATPTRRPAVSGLLIEPLQDQGGRNDVDAQLVTTEDGIAPYPVEDERRKISVESDDKTSNDSGQDMVQPAPADVCRSANLIAVQDHNSGSPDLMLSSACWELPPAVVETCKSLGMEKMFPWQAECLSLEGVLDGNRNLVYSAPTSAGKSFVAEMIVLKKVLLSRKKAIIILPFVSVVSEKAEHLKRTFRGAKLRVEGYFAGHSSSSFENADIAVCTIEKANGLINRLLEEDSLDDVGIVVVDELHVIGDENRGYLLELLLTKLRVVLREDVQIIGMSATLPNIDLLARWLNALLYITDYRPVPLTEYVKVKDVLYNRRLEKIRHIKGKHRKDPDQLVPLCYEVVEGGNSVLIFCATKFNCETVAHLVATLLVVPVDEETSSRRFELLQKLKNAPGGLDPKLAITIPSGVAYHHAGLTMEEREAIEEGYRSGAIKIITATSTLASGVNLPTRRVIFRSPYIGRSFLDNSSYQQMKGRAGRKGKDTMGESVLICKEVERSKVRDLMDAELPPVKSCLNMERRGMKRALLEVIASKVISSLTDINLYVRCTLLYAETGSSIETEAVAESALKFLVENEFVESQKRDDGAVYYKPTKLGEATVASSLSPEEGLVVFRELKQGLQNFVLEDELHLVYHVTPTYHEVRPEWSQFLSIYGGLSDVKRRIGELVGVRESFLISASSGQIYDRTEAQKISAAIHRRFYLAMALNDLVHEAPFAHVTEKYNLNRGQLQSLQMQSSTFAGMVTVFAARLGWAMMELLFHQFQDRLNFGVERELCELAKVPHVKGARARILYQAGLKTVASLATASPEEIMMHLAKARPFRSEKDSGGNAGYQQNIERFAAHAIVRSARQLLEKEGEDHQRTLRNINAKLYKAPNPGGKQRTEINTTDHLPTPGAEHVSVEKDIGCNDATGFEVARVATDEQLFASFVSQWAEVQEYALSIATVFRDNKSTISGLSICWDSSRVFYIDMLSPNARLGEVRSILLRKSRKIIFDAKLRLKHMIKANFHVSPEVLDPKVAAWLLSSSEKDCSLQQMMEQYLPSSEIVNYAGDKTYNCCREACQSWMLMSSLAVRLRELDLIDHFIDLEMPLAKIMAEVEVMGIGFDPAKFETYWDLFTTKLSNLEDEAQKYSSKPFRLNAPDQVARVLFDELQLPSETETKTTSRKTKIRRSTAKDVLEKLVPLHRLPVLVLEYRRIYTLIARQIYPLQNCKVPSPIYTMYRVHTNFDFHTATGRICCSNPNLQNIPHAMWLQELSSSEQIAEEGTKVNMREAFIPAEGNVLLSLDYSQLELRIIAHLSEDEALLKHFQANEDLFKSIASEWLEIDIGDVTLKQRQKAKSICYGVLYGIGPSSLSEELGCTVDEAQVFIESFKAKYPRITEFITRTVNRCQELGYVGTIKGRRRYLKDIYSTNLAEQKHAERQAVNTVVQGSAADLVKAAMIKVDEMIHRVYPRQEDMPEKDRPHLVHQIHDELLFECPAGFANEFAASAAQCMETAMELRVRLVMKRSIGPNWGNLRPMDS